VNTEPEALIEPLQPKENDPMDTLALRSTTLAQLPVFEQVVFGYLARCKSKATLRAYQEDLRNFIAWCEMQELAPLLAKRANLDLYVRWMQAQNRWSESTISRRIGTVCGMYKYAALEEYIQRDPAAGVERPVVDRAKQRRTFLNPVQYAQMLKAAQRSGRNEHALIALLGMMGLRIGEACSLNVEHLTEDAGYRVLHFIGKGNKAAHVPVPIPVMRALDDVIDGRTEGPLLRNRNGDRMDRAAAARIIRRLAKAADVPTDVSPHSLRRTFATSGLLNKVPIYEMQLAMRHVSPSTTALYDMAKGSLDRNATHQVAGFLASMAG
jgi:site-specific recombinase XerD